MKQFALGFFVCALCFAAAISINATSSRRIEALNMSFKRSVTIGKGTNAGPDSSAFLEIGIDSATKGTFLLHMTDTTKVGARKKLGLFILNSADTSLWGYNGKKWKKAGT